MWPFKKKRAIPYADDLTDDVHAWLDQQRAALSMLCREVGLAPPAHESMLSSADGLIAWWHRTPKDGRIDANAIVNAAGVALGDALAAACGLEWKVITDSFGTDLGLWWKEGSGNIILAPVNSVAKKFEHNPDGIVQLLFKAMVPDVLRMKKEGPPKPGASC